MAEEAAHQTGQTLDAAQRSQHQPLELIRPRHDPLANPVGLGMVPDLLDRIELRRVRRQEMQLQPAGRPPRRTSAPHGCGAPDDRRR